jgi:hypothetical protein
MGGDGKMAQLANGNEVVTPSKADAVLAKESGSKLAAHLRPRSQLHLEVKTCITSGELVLPASALRLLVRALAEMGQGNAVTLTRDEGEDDPSRGLEGQGAIALLSVQIASGRDRRVLVRLNDTSPRNEFR